ncbi:hypothetical protein B0T21DRAFT_351989 [Apiosordaria backusii]|uniref:Uncharacterized protein n=1 Tax=Apiosordaria backusii TaxID=314023 RepID=A0AA40AIM8_9PEZI|nr:hypothetical protein B0T21DRAFT_351989 [Apiosordaria backusii]
MARSKPGSKSSPKLGSYNVSCKNPKIQDALTRRLRFVEEQHATTFEEALTRRLTELDRARVTKPRKARERIPRPTRRIDVRNIETVETEVLMAKSAQAAGIPPLGAPQAAPQPPVAAPQPAGRPKRTQMDILAIPPAPPGVAPQGAAFARLQPLLGDLSRLPGELRNKIYEDLVPDDMPISRLQRVADNEDDIYGRQGPQFGLDFVTASSAIYEEAMAVFYSRNEIIIYVNFLDPDMRDPIDTLPPVFRHRVRYLTLVWDYSESRDITKGTQEGVRFPPGWTTRRSRQRRGVKRTAPIPADQPFPKGKWFGKVVRHNITVDGDKPHTLNIFSDFPNTRVLCLEAWLPVLRRVQELAIRHLISLNVIRDFLRAGLYLDYSFDVANHGYGHEDDPGDYYHLLPPHGVELQRPRMLPLRSRGEKMLLKPMLEAGALVYTLQQEVFHFDFEGWTLVPGFVVREDAATQQHWRDNCDEMEQLFYEFYHLPQKNWDPDFPSLPYPGGDPFEFPEIQVPRTGKGSRAFRLDPVTFY